MFKKGKKEKTFSKKRRFDYSRKNFENPFFKKNKRLSSGPDIQTKILAAAGILILTTTVWFFAFCPLWQIEKITVKGLKRMDENEVRQLAKEGLKGRTAALVPRSNSLFFSEDQMASELMNRYHFEEISVKKKLPDELLIELEEKPFVCVWKEEGRAYYSDDDGHIMEEVQEEDIDKEKYPLIINESDNKIKDNRANIKNEYIKFILRLFTAAKENPIGFEVESFLIDNDQETVKMVPKSGPTIKFSTRNGIKEQIEKLILVRHEKLKDDFQKKSYIDLRYGDKIYFQ